MESPNAFQKSTANRRSSFWILRVQHVKHPPPPPDAPGLVSAIAMQALAKKPADRFASAAALAYVCE